MNFQNLHFANHKMKRKQKQNIQWFCVASFIKVTFSKSKKLLFANGTLELSKRLHGYLDPKYTIDLGVLNLITADFT